MVRKRDLLAAAIYIPLILIFILAALCIHYLDERDSREHFEAYQQQIIKQIKAEEQRGS